eukprot:TRINITY_DN742_c1_g1_i13.p2 TRINITY_DN742_c1_g1~~TRINITY_DN742_c1_g1_i13.p2  ORF type:complete len:1190 (+),score=82.88 TRINITY_DN742_c1_g1_i13:407-3976(+)
MNQRQSNKSCHYTPLKFTARSSSTDPTRIQQKYSLSALRLAQQLRLASNERNCVMREMLYYLYRTARNKPKITENEEEEVKSKNISIRVKSNRHYHKRINSQTITENKDTEKCIALGSRIYVFQGKMGKYVYANIFANANVKEEPTTTRKSGYNLKQDGSRNCKMESKTRLRVGKMAKPKFLTVKEEASINKTVILINRYKSLFLKSKDQTLDKIKEAYKMLGLGKTTWTSETIKQKEAIYEVKEKLLRKLYSVLSAENTCTPQIAAVKKCFIGMGNNGELVKSIMKSRYWWVFTNEESEANFLWTPWKRPAFVKALPFTTKTEKTMICNHMEGAMSLGNKKSLYKNLKKYYAFLHKDLNSIIPLTFHIKTTAADPQFTKFKQAFTQLELENGSDHNIWIVKPGENSNRGKSIIVSKSLSEIEQFIAVKSRNHTLIIQKYIERPLLFHGRKFDIRCFALLTSVNGLVKGYFYKEGYLRTSSKKFTLGSLKRAVHLTNEAVQIRLENFGKFEAGNKVSFDEFSGYLVSLNGPDFYKTILPQIKQIVKETIHAVYYRIDPKRRLHTFELLGYDFMIDEEYNVYLIEANVNPCLGTTSKFSSKFITCLVENTLIMALDPLFPPPEGFVFKRTGHEILPELLYEQVFDQRTDGIELEKLYPNKKKEEENCDQHAIFYSQCSCGHTIIIINPNSQVNQVILLNKIIVKHTQMESESIKEEKPIQLITINSSGNFIVNREAIEMIRGIKKKIAVVAVAGQYRTGKSYLLNRLIGRQNGFELGSTINPCTKGLWIWNKPVVVTEDIQAVFLDTEGLASFSRNVHLDTKIFAITLLLSSYFIYNSMNALDEKALESLSLVVSLSKYIHVNTHPVQISEELDEFTQYFPFFMWVVRDFALRLVDSTHQAMTDRQYLENVLRPVDPDKYPDPEQAMLKNEIRGKLSTFFKERDCVTLVRPVSDEKMLRSIDKLPYETLRPEFRTKIELLVKKVYCNVKPKAINGQPLTGEMFANLLEQYVAAFNGGMVPAISTAWEQVLLIELEKTIATAVEEYKQKLGQLANDRLPLSVEELRRIDEEAKRTAYRKFYESGLISVSADQLSEARERMEAAFAELYDKLVTENYNISYQESEDFFNKLYNKIKEQMDQLEVLTFDVISANWQKLREVLQLLHLCIVLFGKFQRPSGLRSGRDADKPVFI